MLAHLGYKSPQGGLHDVSFCKMVLCPAKQLSENCGETVPKVILKSINDVHIEEVEELEPDLSQCGITSFHNV